MFVRVCGLRGVSTGVRGAGRITGWGEGGRVGDYGLSQQWRRAAVSVPANIAEGFRRRGKADKVRFLNIAESSLEECRYYLILAQDLGYGDTSALTASIEEVSKMLNAYTTAVLAS
ncbi:MAG: four helix bundle protein [Acidobacteria bacterium]|nr:four helix bundle protein [Acidobacteriota bacterium]